MMDIVVANGFVMERCTFFSREYRCCVLHNTRCKCEDYNPRNSKSMTAVKKYLEIIPAVYEDVYEERKIKMEYTKIPNIFKREEYGNNKLIEGEYSSDELKLLADIPWVWTEKVDGANIRVIWDGHSVSFGGRTDKAQIPAHLVNKLNELFGGTNKEEIFEQKFGETPVILFGEGFGEKIQKGGGLYGPVNFILFDVFCGGMWLKRDALDDIAAVFGIETVPIVNVGTLPEAVEFIRQHPKSNLRDAEMEGIVCRPLCELADRRGNRIIVKIKCRDF